MLLFSQNVTYLTAYYSQLYTIYDQTLETDQIVTLCPFHFIAPAYSNTHVLPMYNAITNYS